MVHIISQNFKDFGIFLWRLNRYGYNCTQLPARCAISPPEGCHLWARKSTSGCLLRELKRVYPLHSHFRGLSSTSDVKYAPKTGENKADYCDSPVGQSSASAHQTRLRTNGDNRKDYVAKNSMKRERGPKKDKQTDQPSSSGSKTQKRKIQFPDLEARDQQIDYGQRTLVADEDVLDMREMFWEKTLCPLLNSLGDGDQHENVVGANENSDSQCEADSRFFDRPLTEDECKIIDANTKSQRTADTQLLLCADSHGLYQMGHSYLDFLAANDRINFGSFKSSVDLLIAIQDHNIDNDAKFFFNTKLIDKLCSISADFLKKNSFVFASTIRLLCLAGKQEEAQKLFDSFPSDKLKQDHVWAGRNAIARAYFLARNARSGWQSLTVLEDSAAPIEVSTIVSVLTYCKAGADCGKERLAVENFRKLLAFLKGRSDFLIRTSLVRKTYSVFRSLNQSGKVGKFSVVEADIDRKTTVCQDCGTALSKIYLEQEEFNYLKNAVYKGLMTKDNVYKTTDPGELESFKRLLHKLSFKKLDLVVDGLNVMYHSRIGRTTNERVQFLGMVLEELNNKGYTNILVILKSFTRHLVQQHRIFNRAQVFYVNPQSFDDNFALYAALHGGPGTKFMSRDLFTGEKHELDPEARRIFKKWAAKNRLQLAPFPFTLDPVLNKKALKSDALVVSSDNMNTRSKQQARVPLEKLLRKEPPNKLAAQCEEKKRDDGSYVFHIPFLEDEWRIYHHSSPDRWLCIEQKL